MPRLGRGGAFLNTPWLSISRPNQANGACCAFSWRRGHKLLVCLLSQQAAGGPVLSDSRQETPVCQNGMRIFLVPSRQVRRVLELVFPDPIFASRLDSVEEAIAAVDGSRSARTGD